MRARAPLHIHTPTRNPLNHSLALPSPQVVLFIFIFFHCKAVLEIELVCLRLAIGMNVFFAQTEFLKRKT